MLPVGVGDLFLEGIGPLGDSWAEKLTGGVLDGKTIESIGEFQKRFYGDCANSESFDEEFSNLVIKWLAEGQSKKALDEWLNWFRSVGYFGIRDKRVMWRTRPAHPIMVFRLATDWRQGFSWGMDRRSCIVGRKFSGPTAKWWAAIVPPENVLAHLWGKPIGGPMWETVENRKCGPIIRAFDDRSEVVVDPTGLTPSDSLGVGNVVMLADAPGDSAIALKSIDRLRAEWSDGLESHERVDVRASLADAQAKAMSRAVDVMLARASAARCARV